VISAPTFPRLITALAVLFAAVGCSAPRIRQKELIQSSAPPIQRPEILLYKDNRPVEPGSADGISFRLPLSGTGYRAERGPDQEPTGLMYNTFTFAAQKKGEEEQQYRLAIAVSQDRLPPLKRGNAYSVTYYQNHRGAYLPTAQGVVIRDETGRLLYILSSDEAVPVAELPAGLTITPSRRTAFSTTSLTKSGCTIKKTHHFLELEAGGRKTSVTPGQSKTIKTVAGYFKMELLDYSVSSTDIECLMEAPPYYCFLLEAATDFQ